MKQQTLRNIALWLIGLSFFVPLVLLTKDFIFPFIVPKILLMRTLSLLLFSIYIILVVGGSTVTKEEPPKKRMSLLHLGVLGFIGSFIISTFLGVDWYRSLWDTHERMLGLFTVVHYVLFYIAVSELVVKRDEWKRLFQVFLGAGSIVMGIALVQQFDNEWLLNRGNRSASTLGNSIYVSAYGLFLVCLSLFAYVRDRLTVKKWKWWYLIAGILGLIGIFAGGSRGTLLGLIAGALFGLFVYTVTARRNDPTWKKRLLIVCIAGIIAFGGLYTQKDTELVKDIPAVGRLMQTKFKADNARVLAWSTGIVATKDYPVFGWGPNNYYYAFNTYYRPEMLRHGYGETWFDNAHNIVVDTITTRGIVGILTYLFLFVAVLLTLYRLCKQDKLSALEFAILSSFFVGHFVNNIFVFENPTSYLYFFFLIAYVQYLTKQSAGTLLRESNSLVPIPRIATIGIVIGFLIFTTNVNPAKANMATLEAIQALYQGRGITEFEHAISIPTPHVDDVRNDFMRAIGQVIPQHIEAGNKDLADELYELAIRELDNNRALHPMDIRIYMAQANMYSQKAQIEQQATYLLRARALLEEARVYSPNRQQILFTIASIDQQLGNTESVETLLIEAWELDKQIGKTWLRLLAFYAVEKNDEALATLLSEYELAIDTVRFNKKERKQWENILKQVAPVLNIGASS